MAWDRGFEAAFDPRAVAVVGASDTSRARFQGAGFIRNFLQLGFKGRIYPVNSEVSEVAGLKAYPGLRSLPGPVDLVIVSVPAAQVPGVLEECVAVGARNVHVYTAGFSESGREEGRLLEQRVREISLRGGLRVVGPNCMGINVPRVGMMTLLPRPVSSGPVAFVSQSGGHAMNLVPYAASFGIGFSKVISYGNGTVMDSTDFLEYLAADPETRIIGLYLEGVSDGRRLLELVRETNRTKPVVVWKGGMTDTGARAAASHTGSLAGSQAVWEAFFSQSGAVRVNSLEEMADMMLSFLVLPPLSGNRVAVFLGGGGHSVTTADFSAREGMEVPRLGEKTRRELGAFIPLAGTSVNNPVDCEQAMRAPEMFERMLKVVAADPVVDALVVDHQLDVLQGAGPDAIQRVGRAMVELATGDASRKPLLAVLETWGADPAMNRERARLQKELGQAGIGVYRTFPRACRALSR
ncbi:MAG: CoA-binding protein, partial [Chloroflexota bacterium]